LKWNGGGEIDAAAVLFDSQRVFETCLKYLREIQIGLLRKGVEPDRYGDIFFNAPSPLFFPEYGQPCLYEAHGLSGGAFDIRDL
jgi:hypothetical protein